MIQLDVLKTLRIILHWIPKYPPWSMHPIELKDKLQGELCEMESQDNIARVTQPTDRINSFVIREKETDDSVYTSILRT